MPSAIGLLLCQFPLCIPITPGTPFMPLLCSLTLARHKDPLKGTKPWLFLSRGEFAVQGVKVFCLFLQIPGKKNKLRVYYLSWLRNKILRNDPEVEKRQGWVSVGDLEGCVHYKVGKDFLFFSLERCLIILFLRLAPAAFFSFVSGLS